VRESVLLAIGYNGKKCFAVFLHMITFILVCGYDELAMTVINFWTIV